MGQKRAGVLKSGGIARAFCPEVVPGEVLRDFGLFHNAIYEPPPYGFPARGFILFAASISRRSSSLHS
jgi:hypothetical protein